MAAKQPFVFISLGSLGDVLPLAIAATEVALSRIAEKVVLITHFEHITHLQKLVHNFQLLSCESIPVQIFSSDPTHSTLVTSVTPLRQGPSDIAYDELEKLYNLCLKNNISIRNGFLVFNLISIHCWHIAEAFQIPCLCLSPSISPPDNSLPNRWEEVRCKFPELYLLIQKHKCTRDLVKIDIDRNTSQNTSEINSKILLKLFPTKESYFYPFEEYIAHFMFPLLLGKHYQKWRQSKSLPSVDISLLGRLQDQLSKETSSSSMPSLSAPKATNLSTSSSFENFVKNAHSWRSVKNKSIKKNFVDSKGFIEETGSDLIPLQCVPPSPIPVIYALPSRAVPWQNASCCSMIQSIGFIHQDDRFVSSSSSASSVLSKEEARIEDFINQASNQFIFIIDLGSVPSYARAFDSPQSNNNDDHNNDVDSAEGRREIMVGKEMPLEEIVVLFYQNIGQLIQNQFGPGSRIMFLTHDLNLKLISIINLAILKLNLLQHNSDVSSEKEEDVHLDTRKRKINQFPFEGNKEGKQGVSMSHQEEGVEIAIHIPTTVSHAWLYHKLSHRPMSRLKTQKVDNDDDDDSRDSTNGGKEFKISPMVLPDKCILVHHGGAGTTGTALRFGLFHLVLPLVFDQGYWSEFIVKNRVGSLIDLFNENQDRSDLMIVERIEIALNNLNTLMKHHNSETQQHHPHTLAFLILNEEPFHIHATNGESEIKWEKTLSKAQGLVSDVIQEEENDTAYSSRGACLAADIIRLSSSLSPPCRVYS